MNETLRILLADDDHNMTRILATIWRRAGYKVEIARSGSEALDKLSEERFDCVLSDFKMPGLNGIELCRMIQAGQPDLPIVLMTAYSDDVLIQEGLAAGALAVLTKPLDIERLLAFFSFLRQERSLLVVDEDVQFSNRLGELLREQAFKVTPVANPREALEKPGADASVMLWGIKPGDANALDLLQRAREQQPQLTVILMSDGAADVAPGLGDYACLYKPVEMEMLVELLRQVRHRELRRILAT
jgi:DNA-binding NtrC family response regulator